MKLFRFEEDNVEWLANYFLVQEGQSRDDGLSNSHKIKICLRYLRDPGFQRGIEEELGVEQFTVSRTVTEVVPKIVAKADSWIQFPNVSIQAAIMEAKMRGLLNTIFLLQSA